MNPKTVLLRRIMKMTLTIALVICVMLCAAWAQQRETSKLGEAALLSKLKSSDPREIVNAFYQLNSSSAALQSPNVRAALIDLLDREVQGELANRKDGEGESEGDAEFMNDLVHTVGSFGDWSNARQVCLLVARHAVPIDTYAEHARSVVPCLLKRANSSPSWSRGPAVELIVQLLADKKSNLDPNTVETCKQVVRIALHDPADSVRIDVVNELAKDGDPDMIPALEQVSESDPAVDRENRSFWIRVYATKAIEAIQQRAGER
jgi:hypothetical protein